MIQTRKQKKKKKKREEKNNELAYQLFTKHSILTEENQIQLKIDNN